MTQHTFPLPTPPLRYYSGLSLGQTAGDPSALAVLEQTHTPDPAEPARPLYRYTVRHLERWDGTSYPAIAESIATRFAAAPLSGSTLTVDATAIGAAVVNVLHRARPKAVLYSVIVTAAPQAHQDEKDTHTWFTPKKDLVGSLQILLQTERLKVVPALDEAHRLANEMRNFKAAVSLANDKEPWKPGEPLALAVAMAAWLGERSPGGGAITCGGWGRAGDGRRRGQPFTPPGGW